MIKSSSMVTNEDRGIWEFPKIRDTFLGVPHNKEYIILGSTLGSPHFEKLPYVRGDLLENGF